MTSSDKKSRRGLKTCCAVTAIVLIVLLLVLVILYFTILKPKEPESIAHPVKLTNIELVVFPVLKLNVTLALVVTINNRNYGSFKYKDTMAYVNYRGLIVAEAPIVGDKMPARGKLNISTSVVIIGDRLIPNPYFWIDWHAGSFNFTSLTTLQGKVSVFKILNLQAKARSICDISLFVKSKIVNSTCYSKVKF